MDGEEVMRLGQFVRPLQVASGGLILVLHAPYYWLFPEAAEAEPMNGRRIWRLMGLMHMLIGTWPGTLLCLAVGAIVFAIGSRDLAHLIRSRSS